MHLPFNHTTAQGPGAAAGSPIKVGGIRASNRLLAIIAHDVPTATLAGVPIESFVVSDGEILSASVDTAGVSLVVIYAD